MSGDEDDRQTDKYQAWIVQCIQQDNFKTDRSKNEDP
jgi:hypothetical protein